MTINKNSTSKKSKKGQGDTSWMLMGLLSGNDPVSDIFADTALPTIDAQEWEFTKQGLIERGAPTITDAQGNVQLDFEADWSGVYGSYGGGSVGSTPYNFSGALSGEWSYSSGNMAPITSVGGGVNTLLNFVAGVETRGVKSTFDAVYTGAQDHFKKTFGARLPTDLTIGEIKKWQKDVINETHSVSSAIGGLQQVGPSLLEKANRLGLSDDTVFSENVQKNMGLAFLEEDGLSDYLNGDISLGQFQYNLAGTWASLPKDMSGAGRYDGYAGNKAYGKSQDLRQILVGMKQAHDVQQVASVDADRESSFAEAGVTSGDVSAAQQLAQVNNTQALSLPMPENNLN